MKKFQEIYNKYNLLNSKTYELWEAGMLDLASIREYAYQYTYHINLITLAISILIKKSDREDIKLTLRENLNDEVTHFMLWVNFVSGIGGNIENIYNPIISDSAKLLGDTLLSACNESFEKGIGAFYWYEQSSQAVSELKYSSLASIYKISDKKIRMFFEVHSRLDIEHCTELEKIISSLSEEKKSIAATGALDLAMVFFNFLDVQMPIVFETRKFLN